MITVKLSIIKHIPLKHIIAAAIFLGDLKGRGSSFKKNTQGRTKTSIVDAVAPGNKYKLVYWALITQVFK